MNQAIYMTGASTNSNQLILKKTGIDAEVLKTSAKVEDQTAIKLAGNVISQEIQV